MMFAVVIPGEPRPKGNGYGNVGGRIIPNALYARWEKKATPILRAAWARAGFTEPLDRKHHVAINVQVYRSREVGDLLNYFQAVGDVLQGAKVLANDSAARSWDGGRMHIDRERPRVEICVASMYLTEGT